MQPNDKTDRYLHGKLPIGKDEKILGVYRHHWFAYASIWLVAILAMAAVLGISVVFTMLGDISPLAGHKSAVLSGAAVFCCLIALFSFIPVWLRAQEQVVVTEEALLQILQPGIFTSKVSQLNLQHVTDVTVHQGFLGTLLGYGKITVETPGEQDNYDFGVMGKPSLVAKSIIEAHENYIAALESGRLSTTLGNQTMPSTQIDPEQYKQFLAYQQMVEAQKQANGQPAEQSDQSKI